MKKVLLTLTIFLSLIGVVSASSTGTVYCPDNDEPVNLRPSITSPANNSLVCNSTCLWGLYKIKYTKYY